MQKAMVAMALAAACGLAAAQVDVTFRVIQVQDITLINQDPAATTYIGTGPVGLAYDGSSLFVGGYCLSAAATSIGITEITNFLGGPGVRGFAPIPGSRIPSANSFLPDFAGRGWVSMDWSATDGLLAVVDQGSNTAVQNNELGLPVGGMSHWARTTPAGNFTFENSTTFGRGAGGTAWDYNADGLGFTRSSGVDGPAAAQLDFTTNQGGIQDGPVAYDPTFGFNAFQVGSVVYTVANGGPITEVNGFPNQNWRDMDIHPTNGTVVARANNDVAVAVRNADGTPNLTDSFFIDGPDNGNAPFTVLQHVEILHGTCLGEDLIVWNNRPSFGLSLTFAETFNVNGFGGPTDAKTWEVIDDATGLPAVFPTRGGIWGFHWYEPDGLLFMVDSAGGVVYVMTIECAAPCVPDFTGDGVLNIFDIFAFFNAFGGGDLAADLTGEGTLNIFDIFAFFAAFGAGCP